MSPSTRRLSSALQLVLLPDGVAARVTEEDVDLAGAEGVLGAHQDRDDEAAFQVAGQQADGARPPRQQAAGEGVGAEGEPVGGLQDTLTGRRGHLVTAVEGLGGGGDRDPREPGDVA